VSDEADQAQDAQDKMLSAALKKRNPVLEKIGVCHFCEQPVGLNALFCDSDCSKDYEAELAWKKRVGLI